MATDATGTPTSLGIPTYNTAVDAPSGLGFNAAMAIINTLIAAGLTKPVGILNGEGIVYNGSVFARSSITKLSSGNFGPVVNSDVDAAAAISVSKLAAGSNTQILTTTGGVPVWAAPTTTVGYATTLPGSPTDGQEAILVDSTTSPTYQWRFRFNNGSSNTDKWEFIGGDPLLALAATATTVANVAYVDPGTVCSLTVPRSGTYIVEYAAAGKDAGTGITSHISLKKAAAATADTESINVLASLNITWYGGRVITYAATATDVLKLQAKTSSGTLNIAQQSIKLTPVRVS